MKRSVAEPRYAWGGETHHSVGRISEIESDGLLIIEIPNRPIPWQADPSDMEKVEDFMVIFFNLVFLLYICFKARVMNALSHLLYNSCFLCVGW